MPRRRVIASGPRRRVTGSVRFDPYWKVQFYLDRDRAWQDVQARYDTPDAARLAIRALIATGDMHTRWRLMRIDEKGRAPEPEETLP